MVPPLARPKLRPCLYLCLYIIDYIVSLLPRVVHVCGLGWVVGYENGPMDNSAFTRVLPTLRYFQRQGKIQNGFETVREFAARHENLLLSYNCH